MQLARLLVRYRSLAVFGRTLHAPGAAVEMATFVARQPRAQLAALAAVRMAAGGRDVNELLGFAGHASGI